MEARGVLVIDTSTDGDDRVSAYLSGSISGACGRLLGATITSVLEAGAKDLVLVLRGVERIYRPGAELLEQVCQRLSLTSVHLEVDEVPAEIRRALADHGATRTLAAAGL